MAIKGHIVTKETRKKLRDFNLGKKLSNKTKRKISKSLIGNSYALGHRHTLKTRERMSKSHTGKKSTIAQIKSLIGNKRMLGKKHSEKTKRRMSLMRSGKLNGNWKNGVTPVNRSIRTSKKSKEWRKSVFEKDDYTCVSCGSRSMKGKKVTIHAHHIKSFSQYPRLRFSVKNGKTLCVACHKETDNYCGRVNKKNI